MSKERKTCKACGRDDRRLINGYCPRHNNQYVEYGICLDYNPRDEWDTNEIVVFDDHAEIILYDNFFNELENRVLIDVEDVNIVKHIIWKKVGKNIIGNANQYTYTLPQLLLDTNNKVKYLNEDFYDNRKANLDIVKNKTGKHFLSNKKSHKNKIIVTSIGGSTEDVTGSCFAIEYPLDNGNRDLVLVECGGIQTNRIQDDYIANKKMIENIPYNLASAIFVAHCHQDHCQNIPAGITRGFAGTIITNYENSEILKPMLIDSAFIHNRNVMSLNNRGKKYDMLYDESDVYSALARIQPYSVGEIHQLNTNLSFRFVNNNHCVGSTMLELFIKKPSGRVVKIAYTSDIGSRYNQQYRPYSEEREDIGKANCLIMESTYGEDNRSFTKKDAEKEAFEFINKIREVTQRGNRVLVPTFSYDRAQSVMTLIYDSFKYDPKFKNVKVIVDSRLLCNINDVYRNILIGDKLERWNEVLGWENFVFVSEFKKTEILAKQKDLPCVIISSSGMLTAGHSVTYAKNILPYKKDCLCFIGYCSPNTVGGKIQQGNQKTIVIDNVNVPIRCEICSFRTFTGHAQQKELIDFMKSINCNDIWLHHGSREAKENLKFQAEEAFLFSNMTKKIKIIDKKNNQIIL